MLYIFICILACIPCVHSGHSDEHNVTDAPMTLWCSPEHQSDAIVNATWYFNAKPINQYLITTNATNSTYHDEAAISEDSGQYTCSLLVNGALQNYTIDVNGKPRPKREENVGLHEKDGESDVWEQSSADYTVVEGSPITILCSFYGYPTPIITWYNASTDISAVNNSRVQVSEGKLIILEAVPEDRAIYQCHASNKVGKVKVYMFIRVKGKLAPLWPVIGIILEVIALGLIILFCEWREKMKEKEELDQAASGASSAKRDDDDE